MSNKSQSSRSSTKAYRSKNKKIISTFSKDMKFGELAENRFMSIMNKKFGITLQKTHTHCFYDFILDETILIELKRRRVNKNRYPSTIVGYDKIKRFERLNKKNNGKFRFFIVFHFKDSIYFKEHDYNYKYSVSKWVRQKRLGYDDKPKDYAFIDIKDLQPIDQFMKVIDVKKQPKNQILVVNNIH